MTESMKMAIVAINKFMYYSWNYELVPVELYNGRTEYVPTFIKEVKWTCNLDHIVDKWFACTKSQDAHSFLSRFYGEMGDENRKAMVEWIIKNYNGEKKIF